MKIRTDVRGEFYILLALLCLTLPLNWILSAIWAAVVHEWFHILAVMMLGGRIHSLKISANGAELGAAPMIPRKEFICILAGPAGSLLLWPLRRWVPRIALCGLAQGLFNLLPFYPLDGGRALDCLCGILFPTELGEKIRRAVTILSAAFLLLAGLWGSFIKRLGILPAILSVTLLLKIVSAKKSCKDGILRVQ